MKVLFYGAGVLGSLYAGRLHEAGHEVTVLARGHRLAELREYGVVLADEKQRVRTTSQVRVVESLEPHDAYDWIVVLVRKNQLTSVLPALTANIQTPNILFMVNNASGAGEILAQVAPERVVLGFPGAGGTRDGYCVRYQIVPALVQPTTLGEIDGQITPRLQQIADALSDAGFPVALSRNIDAWLKTHVAVVSPIANAIYLAGGDNYRLAATRDGIVLMVRAIREGFTVLQAHNVPLTPSKYHLLQWIPEPVLVVVMQRVLATKWAETVMARHANVAWDEMQQLADEFQALARAVELPTPALDQLCLYIDPMMPALPQGNARIDLNWKGVWVALGVLVALVLSLGFLRRRQS